MFISLGRFMITRPIVPAAVLASAMALGCGCSSSSIAQHPHTPKPGVVAPTRPAATTTTAASVVVRVVVKGFSFTPRDVTVPVGGTVAWAFGDAPIPHNVAFDGGPVSPISASGTWTRGFTRPGTYTYRCLVHSFMVGTVRVTPT